MLSHLDVISQVNSSKRYDYDELELILDGGNAVEDLFLHEDFVVAPDDIVAASSPGSKGKVWDDETVIQIAHANIDAFSANSFQDVDKRAWRRQAHDDNVCRECRTGH